MSKKTEKNIIRDSGTFETLTKHLTSLSQQLIDYYTEIFKDTELRPSTNCI